MSSLTAILTSRRVLRKLPWISGFVLIAGVIAFLIAYVGNTANPHHAGFRPGKVVVPEKETTVKLDPQARLVAGEFLVTAVTRQNLAKAWTITHSSLKQGLTYKQWLTGNIPVQYFPPKAIAAANLKVDWSYPRSAMLEVLILPKRHSGLNPIAFFVGLRAVGTGKHRHWLVDYFAPHYSPAVPDNGSNY